MSILPLSITAPDSPEGVETTAQSSSVTVSWLAVNDTDRYIVTFSQVQGADQQGLCPTDFHAANLTVIGGSSTTVSIAVGGDVESTVTDMLRAYTTYEVTVKAVSDVQGTSQPSEARRVLTSQTGEDCSVTVCVASFPGLPRLRVRLSGVIVALWTQRLPHVMFQTRPSPLLTVRMRNDHAA